MLLLPWEVSGWQESHLAERGGKAEATSAVAVSEEATSRESTLFSLPHPRHHAAAVPQTRGLEAGLHEGPARLPCWLLPFVLPLWLVTGLLDCHRIFREF